MTTNELISALLANLEAEYQAVQKSGNGTIADRRIACHHIAQSMDLVRRARLSRFEVLSETGIVL